MKPRVYVETTIISYLTGRISRDVVVAAHQELTTRWWETRSALFELYVSELVRTEAGRGDREAAAKRLAVVDHIAVLRLNEAAVELAGRLIRDGAIPPEAEADALHLATATQNGMNYLLTWNFAHLANAVHRRRIENVLEDAGYESPVICTPEELMED